MEFISKTFPKQPFLNCSAKGTMTSFFPRAHFHGLLSAGSEQNEVLQQFGVRANGIYQ